MTEQRWYRNRRRILENRKVERLNYPDFWCVFPPDYEAKSGSTYLIIQFGQNLKLKVGPAPVPVRHPGADLDDISTCSPESPTPTAPLTATLTDSVMANNPNVYRRLGGLEKRHLGAIWAARIISTTDWS
jgi:hypothetical protein